VKDKNRTTATKPKPVRESSRPRELPVTFHRLIRLDNGRLPKVPLSMLCDDLWDYGDVDYLRTMCGEENIGRVTITVTPIRAKRARKGMR
jgi:hypothetical protein